MMSEIFELNITDMSLQLTNMLSLRYHEELLHDMFILIDSIRKINICCVQLKDPDQLEEILPYEAEFQHMQEHNNLGTLKWGSGEQRGNAEHTFFQSLMSTNLIRPNLMYTEY